MSALKRRIRYQQAWKIYESWTDEQRNIIANYYYNNWNIEQHLINRLQRQGGSSNAYSLTQEDFNFAFTAQTLGYNAKTVANYFKVKDSTVYDWFNHRSRNREYKKFLQLDDLEKNRLIGCVKTAELSGNSKSDSSS